MKALRQVWPALLAFLAVGCSSAPMLRMEALKDPYDQSVLAPSLTPGAFKKIMVIPPSGTARGQYDAHIAFFEREFLRNGVTVISGAVTGRVVLEESAEKRIGDSGENLSDAERALIMAKKSGADAILQIGELGWSTPMASRFFVLDERDGKKGVFEVTSVEFRNFDGPKHAFVAPVLRFVGRLTNVVNGEVVASFEIKSAANFNLPSRYVASEKVQDTELVPEKESFPYEKPNWLADAERATEESVVRAVCNRILTPSTPKVESLGSSGSGRTAPVLETARPDANAVPSVERAVSAQSAAPGAATAVEKQAAEKTTQKAKESAKDEKKEESEDE